MSEDKWIDAVAKMIKLTQEGILIWEAEKLKDYLKKNQDDSIDLVFGTTYKNKRIRLYRRTYKAYRFPKNFGISEVTLARILAGNIEKEPYWATEVVLDFVSDDGLTLWTYPEVSALSDLLSAVQYQVAKVKDFLNELLSDDA